MQFEVHVSGLHANLTGKIPIVIGTIPMNVNNMNVHSDKVTIDMTGNDQRPVIGWANNLVPISKYLNKTVVCL